MILEELTEKTRERVNKQMQKIPLSEMRNLAEKMEKKTNFPFYQALSQPELSFICEVKRASPSKGVIANDFPYLEIACEYEEAGASALSVLTEPSRFLGQDQYLQEIASKVNIPVLRKDFTISPYMIYQAKVLGASAVLLICSILTEEQIKEYLDIAHGLGLSALVEVHDEKEIQAALKAGAGIIGVNNRNLKDFTVDVNHSLRLRRLIPNDVLFVSESGIRTPEDTWKLKENGTDAVLIGEELMRSLDKKKRIKELRHDEN